MGFGKVCYLTTVTMNHIARFIGVIRIGRSEAKGKIILKLVVLSVV